MYESNMFGIPKLEPLASKKYALQSMQIEAPFKSK